MTLSVGSGLQPPRDPARIDKVLRALEALWKANPDLRLGQIVGNCAGIARKDPYFIEDDRLLELLEAEEK